VCERNAYEVIDRNLKENQFRVVRGILKWNSEKLFLCLK
jgi:hypothetical protein